jgi:hypothetical protein
MLQENFEHKFDVLVFKYVTFVFFYIILLTDVLTSE